MGTTRQNGDKSLPPDLDDNGNAPETNNSRCHDDFINKGNSTECDNSQSHHDLSHDMNEYQTRPALFTSFNSSYIDLFENAPRSNLNNMTVVDSLFSDKSVSTASLPPSADRCVSRLLLNTHQLIISLFIFEMLC